MKIIKTENIPIKMWLDYIEEGALSQAKNLANHPSAFRHIAIMPDAHQGYGMPIGGVFAAVDSIIPNAVGVDIGCGMCSVKSSLNSIDRSTLKKIIGKIRTIIPLGFNHHKTRQDSKLMPELSENMPVTEKEYTNALTQIGTLGGGNHFIEIQKGNDGWIWIMIHSGSRNIGKQVADYYNKSAIKLNEKLKHPIPKEWQLACLPVDSPDGISYLNEMKFCVEFALSNRKLMMEKVKEIFSDELTDISFNEFINIAHNYAVKEKHFGKNVIIHRKGATSARSGETGIIPGSQGSKSYIVSGLGNKESFMSCSHGAGRKMGRKQAERELDLNIEKEKLDSLGILHSIRGKHDLDEASGAYKDISEVMDFQKDLVKIDIELSPLGVVKG
jgi:tRNA-splicing ligase RtcB